MKCCILMGSPRRNGNTAALLKPFIEELATYGVEHELIWLYGKNIEPCVACRTCQTDWSIFGCKYNDDMQDIFDKVLACDMLIFATPIYSWYCTPPMKALLDRLVYGMNKYYGIQKGPALWAGKKVALITTCGYRPEQGADLFENGIKRYCKHSKLQYIGMLAERDLGYQSTFMDKKKEKHSRAFAEYLMNSNSL